MVRPWAESGFRCYCVDIQHPTGFTDLGPNIVAVGCDVREFGLYCLSDRFRPTSMIFAFPPCTHLAASGARWFRSKGLRPLIDALTLVERCRDICEMGRCPWMIENPIGTLSTYWREPDWTFDPCDYGGYLNPPGDAYTKRTCLWTGGGFKMPAKKPVFPTEGSLMHRIPPGPERANIRSATPIGFARAVFEANVSRFTKGDS